MPLKATFMRLPMVLLALFLTVCPLLTADDATANRVEVWRADAQPLQVVLPEEVFPELEVVVQELSKNAPAAAIARERLSEAAGVRLAERSARLPEVGSYAQLNYQTEQRENTGTVDRALYFWGIEANQPVYQWGAIEARAQMGDLRVDAARNNNAASLRALLRDARDLYLRIFRRKVALQLAQETRSIAEQDLARVEQRHQAGELTDVERAEAEVLVAHSEADILQQEHDLQYLELQFRAITGWKGGLLPDFDSALARFMDTKVVEEAPLPRKSPTESLMYQTLQTQIELEEKQYTVANALNLPQFRLVGGIFRDEIDSAFLADSEDRINYFIGGAVTWNIFDGYEAAGLKMAARARKRQLERQAEMELGLYQSEALRLRTQLEFMGRNVLINERLLELSEARLATARRRFDNGAISTNDLLLSQSSRNQAQLSLIDTKINYMTVLSNYLTLTRQDPVLESLTDGIRRPDLPDVINPWGNYR